MDNIKEMCAETRLYFTGLTVFSGIRKSPVIKVFEKLIETAGNVNSNPIDLVDSWSNFLSVFFLHNKGRTFFMYLTDLVIDDENAFTLCAERGDFCEKSLLGTMVRCDLKRFSYISDFDIPMLSLYIADELWKSGFENCAQLIEEGVRVIGELRDVNFSLPFEDFPYGLFNSRKADELAAFIRKRGAGLFGKHHFFYWKSGEGFSPALNPDIVRFEHLFGYDDQRRVLIENTKRFLKGNGANNILLYGDRGTGKSATVKAVCNEFKEQGLRLIEIHKYDILEIPKILSMIAKRGLYFILFIDDLSFESQDEQFTMLKAVLEGGIEARPVNAVVYATSNRRHFVKENFFDRPDTSAAAQSVMTGDARAFDTMQEQFSLADRFGITIVFTLPTRDEFLHIAESIAERKGLFSSDNSAALDRVQFRENALKWEQWFNGRSPRTAGQFVEWAALGTGYPWE
ncbi:MAG: ATP-binding protein [Spirochaetaceae bacterium]|jgi:predicted AAA+ superfamily ATPase|nr:ATP-binding protein [Spirochaetaceae bacterium]